MFDNDCLGSLFQLRRKQNIERKSGKTYIGPGRDGSSGDKMPIECRIFPHTRDSRIYATKIYKQAGWVKTTFIQGPDGWGQLESGVPLESVTNIEYNKETLPERMAIIIHPPKLY